MTRIATFLLLCGLALAAVIAGSGLQVAGLGGSPHRFDNCDMCHLNRPGEGGRNLFISDIDYLCNGCHQVAAGSSHPVGMKPSMAIPDAFRLNWRGQLTCATCHDPHAEDMADNPYMLRSTERGRTFCESCHADALAMLTTPHRTAGAAHNVSKRTVDRSRLADSLDPISFECLQCHDGSIGPDAGYDFDAGSPLSLSMRHRQRSHPIGIDYREKALRDRELRPPEQLPRQISLIDGKIGCTSCHNIYSNLPDMVAMTQRDSDLCRACHLK
ncbi:MAG: hypothetical protein Tsb0017_26160 [Geothermobacteraceae bacterium]